MHIAPIGGSRSAKRGSIPSQPTPTRHRNLHSILHQTEIHSQDARRLFEPQNMLVLVDQITRVALCCRPLVGNTGNSLCLRGGIAFG